MHLFFIKKRFFIFFTKNCRVSGIFNCSLFLTTEAYTFLHFRKKNCVSSLFFFKIFFTKNCRVSGISNCSLIETTKAYTFLHFRGKKTAFSSCFALIFNYGEWGDVSLLYKKGFLNNFLPKIAAFPVNSVAH